MAPGHRAPLGPLLQGLHSLCRGGGMRASGGGPNTPPLTALLPQFPLQQKPSQEKEVPSGGYHTGQRRA